MGYIHELRALTGNHPLILAGATLLAINPEGQLLMVKRVDNNCWGVPGGIMEIGETIEGTLKREVLEEIGIHLNGFELFGVYSGPELYYRYPNGAEVYNISIAYIVHNFQEAITVNPEEHCKYQFFDLNALPDDTSPPIRPILRDLQKRLLA